MKKIAISLMLLGLTGCSAGMINQSKKMLGLKLYQDSQAEHTSNIRIEHNNIFSVTLYPIGCITSLQPKFQMLPEVNSAGSLKNQLLSKPIEYKQKLLNMPFPPEENRSYSEFKLPANRLLAIGASKGYYNGVEYRGCGVNAIYKFSENKNYELLDNTSQCSLQINEIRNNGERVELKPLKYLNNVNEWAGCDAQIKDLQ